MDSSRVCLAQSGERSVAEMLDIIGHRRAGPPCACRRHARRSMGVVAASAGEAPGVATAVLTPSRVEEVRAKNPSLANRRFTVSPV